MCSMDKMYSLVCAVSKKISLVIISLIIPVLAANAQRWDTVGHSHFISSAGYTSIAIDSNNIPYVACQLSVHGGPAVMKYTGGSWIMVGAPGFTGGESQYTSLALDS